MHFLNRLLMSLVTLLLLSACAADPTLGDVDWKHGARRGVVESTFAPDLSPELRPRCLAGMTQEQYGSQRFVRVRYRHVRLMQTAVAPVPADLKIGNGDVVELWPADCSAGGISRLSRALRTSTPP
jgi:hypothetical protein